MLPRVASSAGAAAEIFVNAGLDRFVDRHELGRDLVALLANHESLATEGDGVGSVLDLDLHLEALSLGEMIAVATDQHAGRAPIDQRIGSAIDLDRSGGCILSHRLPFLDRRES